MKLLAYVFLFIAIVVPLVLGAWWLIWKLWLFVLPAIWATGPENLINPSYWLFVGMLVLVSLVGNALFGRSSK
jgi:hypothetical protein